MRPAQPTDTDQIFNLIVELAEYERAGKEVVSTPALLAESLFPADREPSLWGHVVVDATNGELAGMVLWFLNYSTWEGTHGIYVEDLYMKPEMRGHGLGQQLLATLATTCIERGYARLELSVLDWNTPSIAFYERCGGEAMTDWVGYRFTPNGLVAAPSGRQDL
ncbi:MAG: GNAT family N-acetyltransferase [Actinobacteria bacterium]|nr:GNAT family N-acetyltransferase [Actinomycetota bacterium]